MYGWSSLWFSEIGREEYSFLFHKKRYLSVLSSSERKILRVSYSKCSKISNTFLLIFSTKRLAIKLLEVAASLIYC